MKRDQLKPPLAGVIYGGIVYWGMLPGDRPKKWRRKKVF